ncbi:hypothetical protein VB005_06391 [Metarhizium brunneum]
MSRQQSQADKRNDMQVKQAEPTVGLAGIDRFLRYKKGAMGPLSIADLSLPKSRLPRTIKAVDEDFWQVSLDHWRLGEIVGAQRSDDD